MSPLLSELTYTQPFIYSIQNLTTKSPNNVMSNTDTAVEVMTEYVSETIVYSKSLETVTVTQN